MSSNDGTRSADAYESWLAQHSFPVSLNWLTSRGGTFLGKMLLVNQANDHGEITACGVADSMAYDAKDRIEARLEQRCRHRRRTAKFLPWATRRLLTARRRVTRLVGADDDATGDRRVTQRRPAQGGVFQQCVCRETHCWPVFEGFRACFRLLDVAVDARISPADKV